MLAVRLVGVLYAVASLCAVLLQYPIGILATTRSARAAPPAGHAVRCS
jgi:hypothetical protein